VSTRLGGTYAFDTARGSWRREGDWTLPFEGRAQYVADYGLWFGFSNSDRGGFVLRAANFEGGRPVQRHIWPDVDGIADHADEWYTGDDYLSYLGASRFCVTRFLTSTKDFRHIAVVTALEATLAAGSEELHMVRKASRCYHFSKVFLSLSWKRQAQKKDFFLSNPLLLMNNAIAPSYVSAFELEVPADLLPDTCVQISVIFIALLSVASTFRRGQ
jgi:hypothetical protein